MVFVFVILAIVSASQPSFAAGAWNVRAVGQIGGGEYKAVHVVSNRAYGGDGFSLAILDVSNPSSPVQLSRIVLSAQIEDVFVSGGKAFVVAGQNVHIIDVSNPSQPNLLWSYDLRISSKRIYVSGTKAYLASSPSPGLKILDVSNPSSPTVCGSYPLPYPLPGPQDVFVSGNYAYVAASKLAILNVSNPSSPTLAAFYGSGCTSVYVSGNYAYVGTDSNLQVVDVSVPTQPILRGVSDPLFGITDVFTSGNYAYVTDRGGLRIIDVSDAFHPTLRATRDTSNTAVSVCVSGSTAYVADTLGLAIIDVANPASPAFRASEGGALPNFIRDICVDGGMAYVAYGYTIPLLPPLWSWGGFQIIDVAIPTACRFRGGTMAFNVSSYGSVDVSGTRAYVQQGGLAIFDVTNPDAPVRIGSHPEAGGITVSGGMAYLAQGSSGLRIVDVSNPSSPTLRGHLNTPGPAGELFVANGYAYVTAGDYGLLTIDVSDPWRPTLRASCNIPGTANGVAYKPDRWALVAGSAGLHVIDITSPSRPILRTSYQTAHSFSAISYASNLAYILDGDAWEAEGLRIVDVSNPSSPTLCGSYGSYLASGSGPDQPSCIYASNGLVYIPGQYNGLWVLRYTGNAPRIQTATISDVNNNGTIENGDQLVLTMDRSVVVTTSILQTRHFFVPVQGDSLGGTGFRVGVNPLNSRQIVLTLGTGAHLTAPGTFTLQRRSPNAPSGIDLAASLPPQAIVSLDGVPATDGGDPGTNDSGVDIQLSVMPQSRAIGRSGGTVAVVNSPDAAYRRDQLSVPRYALATTTTFTLRPPVRNLGVIDALQVQSSNPNVSFAAPATIRLDYREGDIDRERGKIQSEMRIHQLVENPRGVFKYVPIPGAQILSMTARQVSVNVRNLNPRGSLSADRVFAGLPIETVDERAINIAPAPGGSARGAATAVLTAGTSGAYTLHKIVIPNYATTGGTDPNRWVVRMRTATLAERNSVSGGRSFPTQSGAIFTVAVEDTSSRPVCFTSPVHLTVQFKNRPDPTQTDIVLLDGRPGANPANMRLVRHRWGREAVDFTFTTAPLQVVNVAQGTVTVSDYVGLTRSDGSGTFGVVVAEGATPAARWNLYR
jgi:hypothetical protein